MCNESAMNSVENPLRLSLTIRIRYRNRRLAVVVTFDLATSDTDPLDEKLTYSEAITMLRKLQRYLFQEHSDLAPTLLKMESKLEKTEAKKRMKRSHKSSILDYLTVDDT
ncbi:hypothetical protein T4B_4494 [Trichinella pseudospiralis]|uniref:Uncharacterized protein n=1 Tax=Trichinella pseudospiralis TaxID=6337 RepID=A0A0V1IW79_TRIPS|nr:hypothetical protein T4B_4494 [Trichinella pseudospiralis]